MRFVVMLGLAAVTLFVGLGWYLWPLSPNIVALQLSFTPGAFGHVIQQWTAHQHLALYRNHLPFDFVLLVVYGSFGYMLATRTAWFAQSSLIMQTCGRWTMPLAAGFDAVENLLHFWLTEQPRLGTWVPYFAAGIASTIKWLLLIAFSVAACAAWISKRAVERRSLDS